VTDVPAPVLPDGTVQPLTDLPLSAAVEELTGFETLAVEAHFRSSSTTSAGSRASEPPGRTATATAAPCRGTLSKR
jgi:hypothetical protein